MANALSDCDISNIEHKIEFLKNMILNQNKDYFRDTGLPSKIDNNQMNTQEMSLCLKQNLKTSVTNNPIIELVDKENVDLENESILANRSKFGKKKQPLLDQFNKQLN